MNIAAAPGFEELQLPKYLIAGDKFITQFEVSTIWLIKAIQLHLTV